MDEPKLPSFVGMFKSGDGNLSQDAKDIARGRPRGSQTEDLEIVAEIYFTRTELYRLIESVPDSQIVIHNKLQRAREALEREHQVYGGGCTFRPKEIA